MQKAQLKPWLILACLVVPMFASYFFDDIYSTLSHLFSNPAMLELGWDSGDYGFYAGGYSFLCVCGGLVFGGILLDLYGVRRVGSAFVGLMALGAGVILFALLSGMPPKVSLSIAYVGRMLFGLGSEIAGVAVTRSIAKWFKGGRISLAMGLQLAIARLGTAAALIVSPLLVSAHPEGQVYKLIETAAPAAVGLGLIIFGGLLWALFVKLDSEEKENGGVIAEEDRFRWKDILTIFANKRFVGIALLCVTFYCCIVSFKKFGTAILIPRFGMDADTTKWMISMIPFSTVVFTPLFGALVDKFGKAEKWMLFGAVLVLCAHVAIAFAPQGSPFWGFLALGMLGIGYSLVPSAMWPSVPSIVPERNLGTAYSLIYWIQNLGLMSVPVVVGKVLSSPEGNASASVASVHAEFVFIGLGIAASIIALFLLLNSRK